MKCFDSKNSSNIGIILWPMEFGPSFEKEFKIRLRKKQHHKNKRIVMKGNFRLFAEKAKLWKQNVDIFQLNDQ